VVLEVRARVRVRVRVSEPCEKERVVLEVREQP
jgi:hypothetical protein